MPLRYREIAPGPVCRCHSGDPIPKDIRELGGPVNYWYLHPDCEKHKEWVEKLGRNNLAWWDVFGSNPRYAAGVKPREEDHG